MNVQLDALKAALTAEGVELPEEVLDRVWRKLTNPDGCEHCGQHVKVGVNKVVNRRKVFVTACCGTEI
jgi:hypothetical protein